jgi:hypothetical protein
VLTTVWLIAFAVAVLYAVLGNVAVYIVLMRRGVPVRSMWAGTPGYLYRVCARADGIVGAALRRFALSTNIAFLLAFLFALGMMGSTS